MAIQCWHCRKTHESVAEVRACAQKCYGLPVTTGQDQSTATSEARKQPGAAASEFGPEVKKAIKNSKIIAAELKNTEEKKANRDRSLSKEIRDKQNNKRTRSSRWDPPASSADGPPVDPRYK